MRRLLHRLPVHVGDQPAARQAVHIRLGDIVASEDRNYAGRLLRLLLANRLDRRVGVRRADEIGVSLTWQRHVVRVLPAASDEAIVLAAPDRLADEVGGHNVLLTAWPRRP